MIAILTATGEKFATLEADSKAQEDSDEKGFNADMMASEADKSEKRDVLQMRQKEADEGGKVAVAQSQCHIHLSAHVL